MKRITLRLTPKQLRDLLAPGTYTVQTNPFGRALDVDKRREEEEANSLAAHITDAREELERLQGSQVGIKKAIADYRPTIEANRVIDNAAAQVLDLAKIFFESPPGPHWYEGVRAGLAALVSTLGIEVDDVSLEESLKPPQSHLDIGPSDGSVPPAGFEDLVAPAFPHSGRRPLRRATLGADSADTPEPLPAVPECEHPLNARVRRRYGAECLDCRRRFEGEEAARFMASPSVPLADPLDAAAEALALADAREVGDAPRESWCKHCGTELRTDERGVWIDSETHINGDDGHTHAPTSEPTNDPEIHF